MRVVDAWDENGNTPTKEQREQDAKPLVVAHEQAKKTNPTWEFFGGIIEVNHRRYQVC